MPPDKPTRQLIRLLREIDAASWAYAVVVLLAFITVVLLISVVD